MNAITYAVNQSLALIAKDPSSSFRWKAWGLLALIFESKSVHVKGVQYYFGSTHIFWSGEFYKIDVCLVLCSHKANFWELSSPRYVVDVCFSAMNSRAWFQCQMLGRKPLQVPSLLVQIDSSSDEVQAKFRGKVHVNRERCNFSAQPPHNFASVSIQHTQFSHQLQRYACPHALTCTTFAPSKACIHCPQNSLNAVFSHHRSNAFKAGCSYLIWMNALNARRALRNQYFERILGVSIIGNDVC